MDEFIGAIGLGLIVIGVFTLNVWLIGLGIALILALCIF